MTDRQRIAVTRLADVASRRLIANRKEESVRLSRSQIGWALDGMRSTDLPLGNQTIQFAIHLWRVSFSQPLTVHRVSERLRLDER